MKILVIDDHPLVAEGMASVFRAFDESNEVESAASGAQGLALARERRPDLILLDIHLPDTNGFLLLETLSEELPATPVVIVSGSLESSDINRAIGAGAVGYIPKATTSEIMKNALQLIMAGGIYLPPELLSKPAKAPTNSTTTASDLSKPNLTPRQLEVLVLLSEGKVNKEIARALDCAETTVKAHVTAVFKELRARNRTEAVINAQKVGLLEE